MKSSVVVLAIGLFAAALFASAAFSLASQAEAASPAKYLITVATDQNQQVATPADIHLHSQDFWSSPATDEAPIADVSKLSVMVQLLAAEKSPFYFAATDLPAIFPQHHTSGTPPDLNVILCRFLI